MSLSLQFHTDSISVNILNYTIGNFEILHKMLSAVFASSWDLRQTDIGWHLLLILYLNNFPGHVRTHVLYHSLCNLMQIPFLLKFLTTLFQYLRFRTKC